ncbi:MAG: efflux RND transporter periplasmic adaptor subunit [Myxococcota bacterium]
MKKLLLVVSLALAAGLAWRWTRRAAQLERAERPPAPPAVRVVSPRPAAATMQVSLPGTVRPRDQVTLYARSNGFLRSLLVDLGDVVKKDQVLARLDAPDLAASLASAEARLAQAKASLALVRGQHERTVTLGASGNLSAQDVDASALRLQTAESELKLATAEHERLSALVGYLTVRAPFDGTINRRYVDDGALVSAERTALFDLATTGALQLDVDVPQWAAGHVRPGLPAKVTAGGVTVAAHVSRAAGALDPVLRTLHTELVPDEPGRLVPGAYVRVSFEVPRDEAALQVPGAAVALRGGAPTVAVVGLEDRVRFVPVKIARELGREVEVLGDLAPGARVALYPPPSLEEGAVVRVVEAEARKP